MDMSKPAIIVPGQEKPVEQGGGKRLSVAIIIPSGDHVHANFAMALAFMLYVTPPPAVRLALVNAKGSNVAKQRNNGIAQALLHEVEWICMIDSDMTFPGNALARLLTHQKDVVGCTYARRCMPHDNLAKPLGGKEVTVNGGLLEVDALPTGFLLFRAEVLKRLRRPYFRFDFTEEDEAAGVKPEITGEDYDFCARLRAAGVPIWLDVDLSHELVHWGEHGIQLTTGQDANDAAATGFQLLELPGG